MISFEQTPESYKALVILRSRFGAIFNTKKGGLVSEIIRYCLAQAAGLYDTNGNPVAGMDGKTLRAYLREQQAALAELQTNPPEQEG